MNTNALILMLVVQGVVTGLTAYFFIKILFSKKPFEQDTDE